MILVAGGSGNLGRLVVRLLRDVGEPVRVLTRDPARCRALPADVEIVTGDVTDPSDVANAMRGCRGVVSAIHGFAGPGNPTPERIDREGNRVLIDAARTMGVANFVLVSIVGVCADHAMSLHRSKFAAEDALRRSGVPFTIVRATAFMETWAVVIGSPLADKGFALVFGPGTNPINFVSVRDVAPLVVDCVYNRVPVGATLEIGGPENLSFVSIAERLVSRDGKGKSIKHIPLILLRAMSILARPFAPEFARKATAAVVLNTTNQTFQTTRGGALLNVPQTTLDDVLSSAH